MTISLLTETCDIVRRIKTASAVGRPTYTDESVITGVRCKLDPTKIRSSERPDPGAIQSVFRGMLYMENVEAIVVDMIIVLNSVRYQIVSINPVTNFLRVNHLEVEVVRQENV